MNDLGWIDAVLGSARPQVMGALLRYFRDLDTAEEAFQEACLGGSTPLVDLGKIIASREDRGGCGSGLQRSLQTVVSGGESFLDVGQHKHVG